MLVFPRFGFLLIVAAPTGPQSANYSFDFDEINNGGIASKSENDIYSMQDAIDSAAGKSATQLSTNYVFGTPLDNDLDANIGLVVITGTKIKVTWSEDNKPAGAKGYHLERAVIGSVENNELQLSGFEAITDAPWANPEYVDVGVLPNTFYAYVIYIIHADDKHEQWMPPLIFKTGAENIDETLQLHIFGKGELISAPSLRFADLNGRRHY